MHLPKPTLLTTCLLLAFQPLAEAQTSKSTESQLAPSEFAQVYTAAEIEGAGARTIAEFIGRLSQSSFGNVVAQDANHYSAQAFANLRGLGATGTKVLMDGRAMISSPEFSFYNVPGQRDTGVDLSQIPLALVDRIEVYYGGQSSKFGSGAVAGVINIVTKAFRDELAVRVNTGWRERDSDLLGEPTQQSFTLSSGFELANTEFSLLIEHSRKDGLIGKDRDFTASMAADLNGDSRIEMFTEEASGWSLYGSNISPQDWREILPIADCADKIAAAPDYYQELSLIEDWGPGSRGCAFAESSFDSTAPEEEAGSLFIKATHAMSEVNKIGGFIRYSQNKDSNRASPQAFTGTLGPEHAYNPYDEEARVFTRLPLSYPKRSTNKRTNLDFQISFDTQLSLTGQPALMSYYQFSSAKTEMVGENILQATSDTVERAYGGGLSDAELRTLKNTLETNSKLFVAELSYSPFEWLGASYHHSWKVSYEHAELDNRMDALSDVLNFSHGAGVDASRNIAGLHHSSNFTMTSGAAINLSVGLYDYSDIGAQSAFDLYGDWPLLPNLNLFASGSRSFIAPNMLSTHGIRGASPDIRESAFGFPAYDIYLSGNKDLAPEVATDYQVGVKWQISEHWGIKVIGYDHQVEDKIALCGMNCISAQLSQGDWPEFTAQPEAGGLYGVRPGGADTWLTEVGTGLLNLHQLDSTGSQIEVFGKLTLSFADLLLSYQHNKVYDHKVTFQYGERDDIFAISGFGLDEVIADKLSGTLGMPSERTSMSASLVREQHSVTWRSDYTSATNDDTYGKVSDYRLHYLTYQYSQHDGLSLILSLRNALDEEPALVNDTRFHSPHLYDIYGRDIQLSVGYRF